MSQGNRFAIGMSERERPDGPAGENETMGKCEGDVKSTEKTGRFLRADAIGWSAAMLVVGVGCTLDGQTAPRSADDAVESSDTVDGATPMPLAARTSAEGPTAEQIEESAAALARPVTIATAHQGDHTVLVLARREGNAWMLEGSFDRDVAIEGCPSVPCTWPTTLVPDAPLLEPAALTGEARDHAAYVQALLTFEGPLNVQAPEGEDTSWVQQLPATAWSDPMNTDLAAFIEPLRRYHPMGQCSMDQGPQLVSMMRAVAAAQSGHTGWAVQGWMDTVSYWASSRSAWSSYGQSHPTGHFAILDLVNVDRRRVVLGALFQLPNSARPLYLSDAHRIVEDAGPEIAADVRRLMADPAIDPYNRARLFASVASLPLTEDPQFASLPPLSRAIVEHWSR